MLHYAALFVLACVSNAVTSNGKYEEIGKATHDSALDKLYVYFTGPQPEKESLVTLSQTSDLLWRVIEAGEGGTASTLLYDTHANNEATGWLEPPGQSEMTGGLRDGGGWTLDRAPVARQSDVTDSKHGYDALMRQMGEKEQCVAGQDEGASERQCAAHSALFERIRKDMATLERRGARGSAQKVFEAANAHSRHMGTTSDYVFVQIHDNKLYCVPLDATKYTLHQSPCFPDAEDHTRLWGVLVLLERALLNHRMPDAVFALHTADGPRVDVSDSDTEAHLIVLSEAKTDDYADVVFPGHSFVDSSYHPLNPVDSGT